LHIQAQIYTKDEIYSHTFLLKQHRTLPISIIIRNAQLSGNPPAAFDSKTTKLQTCWTLCHQQQPS